MPSAEPSRSVRGWATAADEQERIVAAVEDVLADPASGDGDVVIVSHGAVGNVAVVPFLGRAHRAHLRTSPARATLPPDRDTRHRPGRLPGGPGRMLTRRNVRTTSLTRLAHRAGTTGRNPVQDATFCSLMMTHMRDLTGNVSSAK